MELADSTPVSITADFQTEALIWLPNVARYARLLARDQSEADDLAQETFLRAYENWGRYEPGSDCRKWLFTICRNIFLRERQRSKRMISVDDPEVVLQSVAYFYREAIAHGLDALLDQIDLAPALERGLRGMLPEYRAAVVLVDIEDQSYADAAATLGIPIGTVRSRLFRGRRLLQEALIDYARDLGLGKSANVPPSGEEERQ